MRILDTELEQITKFVELRPLQKLAASRVAISVNESEDVQYIIGSFSKVIGNCSVGFSDDQWKQLCGTVRSKLDQIGVPKLIADIILETMWPISFEICKWIICHDADMGIDSTSKFCWTQHVNIDYEETAASLVKTVALNIKKRFKLACFYCLDLEVRSLWEMMSLSEKRSFFVRGNLKKSDLNPIILYWTYYIQELPIDAWGSKTLNFSQLFKYAVENGHFYATKYFLGKIKKQLRNRMISNCFSIIVKGSHLATACFLINELPSYYWGITITFSLILRRFLEWPLQKHFMAVADRFTCHFRETVYGELLEAIFEKDLGGFKDYDYKKLFIEFWHQSPSSYKTYVNTESRFGFKIFFRFVKKHFGFVFDENSFALKAKFRAIVFQREIPEDIAGYVKEDVEFFKFLIRGRITTKLAIDRFAYESSINSPYEEFGISFHNLPLGELMYLIDGILGIL